MSYLQLLNAAQLREVGRRVAAHIEEASPYFTSFDSISLAGMREYHAKKVWLGM